MRVFSFGASTAQGAKDDVGGGFIGRIGTRLEKEQLGHAENYGIGGENTTQMVPRLSGVPASSTDVVIVTLGINDVARHPDAHPERRVELEKHKANVREILSVLKDRCSVIYASQYPVQYMQLGFDSETVAAYRLAGVAIAEDLQIDVVDIFALIDDARFRQFIHDDGMHFNAEGHEFIAKTLWTHLKNKALI